MGGTTVQDFLGGTTCFPYFFLGRGVGDNVFSICFPYFFGGWRKQTRISGINLNLQGHRRLGGWGVKTLLLGNFDNDGYPLILEQTLSLG